MARTKVSRLPIKVNWKRRARYRSKGEQLVTTPLRKNRNAEHEDEASSKATKANKLKYSSTEVEMVPETQEVEAAMQPHQTK